MKVKKDQELTAENLKVLLWETLQGLKNGTVKTTDANAIAMQSRSICQIARVQLDYHKAAGSKPNPSKLLT